MQKPLLFKDTLSFFDYNCAVLKEHFFVFYGALAAMRSSKIDIYALYNVPDWDGTIAYGMHFTGGLTIHASKWSKNTVDQLIKVIDFEELRGSALIGQKQLILTLVKKEKINYRVFKDRLVYQCEDVAELKLAEGIVSIADIGDVNEISRMAYQYHLQEYKEHAYRTSDEMADVVLKGINNNNIFKLSFNEEVCSMLQVMDSKDGFPMIGLFFTKDEHKGKGYGTQLLHEVTARLLSNGRTKVGLISDIENERSNSVFKQVGYKSVYEQISVSIL